ncbi:hypothetical protein PG991_006775 [Apiospora marii]|uniref:Uncharacterized protein n=2 Tax=Apiospora marii TaxID=335849 RepID=A0ABR1S0F6_9PEZI
MPATLWLVRHAEGLHNALKDWDLPDPVLTDLGEIQARNFYETHGQKMEGKVAAIFASPSKRTILTARLCFAGPVAQGKRISLDPDLMECTPEPPDTCNIPSHQYELLEMFGNEISVANLSSNEYMDRGPKSRFRDTRSAWSARMARARESLFRVADALGDDEIIAVVSHFHCLRWLVGSGGGEELTHWSNCEVKPYRFQADPFIPGQQHYLVHSPSSIRIPCTAHLPPMPTPAQSSPLFDPDGAPISPRLRSVLAQRYDEQHGRGAYEAQMRLQWANRARPDYAVAVVTPPERRLLYNIERLTPLARLRARQMQRFAQMHPNDHEFMDVNLRQAAVIAPDPWWTASAEEAEWPAEWKIDGEQMDAYMEAFHAGWRLLFPYV